MGLIDLHWHGKDFETAVLTSLESGFLFKKFVYFRQFSSLWRRGLFGRILPGHEWVEPRKIGFNLFIYHRLTLGELKVIGQQGVQLILKLLKSVHSVGFFSSISSKPESETATKFIGF